ncbi:hypothetical protein C2G38_2196959 [Gigaspora rosea]|uniref:BTB domain-containing protein n=1 Tax=Gigaspora rosea TaxID=44941 RepID=A0A397UUF4_9GLOM|nr:hypothetical protein C2G38_2196959 [Gigaspora rosea]
MWVAGMTASVEPSGGYLNRQPKVAAHSIVLKYRSLYFRNELANINSDENHVKTVNLKHVSTQQFEIIIK